MSDRPPGSPGVQATPPAGQPGSVGLVVNTYERTYREVLSPGFFPEIAAQNRRECDEVVALVNNVVDRADARDRAEALVAAGEISAYAFVADHLDEALRAARLPARALRRRPYLLDYGLVMPHVVGTRWLLGWDAETRLPEATDWLTPSLDLLVDDRRVFHTSLAWSVGPGEPGPLGEAVDHVGDFALGWGFSDQLFLVRRDDLVGPIWRSFAPAAAVRHAPHPYTFEYRVEAHQRAVRRHRATLTTARYETNNLPSGVVERDGRSWRDDAERRALRGLEAVVVSRLPVWVGPRYHR